MENRQRIIFNGFTLDSANESLWKGSERVHLRPKTFSLLQYLVTYPGQLVTKEQLLNALWRDCHVGDEALKHCVAEIRKALKDPAEAPRLIETAHRRGYRFIGEIERSHAANSVQQALADWHDREMEEGISQLVGRASELEQLHQCMQKAMEGVRQVVFVTGEQGIGKTALVDAFLNSVRGAQARDGKEPPKYPRIARGQCIKSHGAGEAYMPLCEALTELCHKADHKRIISVLRQYAPLWLLQMPSLISTAQLRSLRLATLGATRERMLREMAEALEALTVEMPLILVLEDLHWSDYSTLDLISYWAQRRGPARLLIIATYRPAEAMADGHPLRAVKQELHTRQQCQEVPLAFLSEAAVEKYLMQRFRGHCFPSETAAWIQERTDGNPLFMINILDHLVARGLIVQRDKNWILDVTLENASVTVPPTIQQIIEQQIERCTPQELRLLQAGSVEGVEFSVGDVAAALGEKLDRIEARCRALAGRNLFLQPAGTRQVAGRQVACYRFIHALYQNIWYLLLPEELRARLHLRIAEHIEATGGQKPGELAARLAMHFDRGRDFGRSINYYQQAADNANSRYAGREALGLATRGMELLAMVPDAPELKEIEMCLQIALGSALMSTQGLGDEGANRAFSKARELFQQLSKRRRSSKKPLLFSALYGMWSYHWVHADYPVAREMAELLLQLAEGERNALIQDQAHRALGTVMLDHGEFAEAYKHLEKCTDVISRCLAWIAKCSLGYPEQARKNIEVILAYALETRNPESIIFAHLGAARVHMTRNESQKALNCVQLSLELALQHGLAELWIAPMKGIRAWALARLGQVQDGLEQARQALAVFRAIGVSNLKPLILAIFAEISLQAGEIEQGLAAIEEALEEIGCTGMLHSNAEIYRLKGELLWRQTAGQGASLTEVESCFKQAIETARQQQAKLFELRATASLARFLLKQNRQPEASDCLKNVYQWFTEGHNTPDLQEARELLRKSS